MKNVTIMAKSMHETSQSPAERDLPYQTQWVLVVVTKRCYQTFQMMAKSMHVTSKVRRKGICYTSLRVKGIWTGIDIFVQDA